MSFNILLNIKKCNNHTKNAGEVKCKSDDEINQKLQKLVITAKYVQHNMDFQKYDDISLPVNKEEMYIDDFMTNNLVTVRTVVLQRNELELHDSWMYRLGYPTLTGYFYNI